MTNKIEIVDTIISHVRQLRETMRTADKQEIIAAGFDPARISIFTYKNACWRRTGLVNGEPAAMWGVRGNLLGLVGQPYLLTNEKVHLISPLKFAKIYIQEVKEMKKLFPVLENYVDASYEGACRMLELAGFKLEPVIINYNQFYRFSLVS